MIAEPTEGTAARDGETCPVCDRSTDLDHPLCSDRCVREAVHEIERLSARRKRLHARQRTDRGSAFDRLLGRGSSVGSRRSTPELSEVAARIDQLMSALMRTRRGTLSPEPTEA